MRCDAPDVSRQIVRFGTDMTALARQGAARDAEMEARRRVEEARHVLDALENRLVEDAAGK